MLLDFFCQIQSCFPVGPPQGEDGELLPEIVAVDDPEFLDGVGGNAVLPAGTDRLIRVPDTLGEDLPAVLDEQLISMAHGRPSFVDSFPVYQIQGEKYIDICEPTAKNPERNRGFSVKIEL